MDWMLDKKRPICPQICERLCILIATEKVGVGERLMSVREVALQAGVTPNTVQKSFEQLEQKGVIYSRCGSGWYVNEDIHVAQEMMRELVNDKTGAYLNDMHSLGLKDDEIINVIKEYRYE